MPFSIAAAGIGAAGALGSAAMQSGNAGKAGAQAQRNLQMILPQMQTNYATAQNQLLPIISAGMQGTTASADLLGLNGPDAAAAAMQRYQTSPGYEWQLGQGLRGVDAIGAAGRSLPGVRSGATMKAEMGYAESLANQDFGQYFSRLTGLSSLGDTGVGQLINAGNSLIAGEEGNAQSQNAAVTGAANAQNSILGNTFSGLGNTVNSLLTNPNVQSALSGLFGNTTVGDYSIPGTSTFGPYGSLFGSPAAGTGGGFNNGADLVAAGGGITIPPVPPGGY